MNSLYSKQKPFHHFLLSPSSRFLCFSLFSTSTSSTSSPLSLSSSESRNVRVSVWWDIENCGVPIGINVLKIAHSITSAVRVNGIKGPVQISAFGDVLCLSRSNQEALSSIGINLIHVPCGKRNSCDTSLLVDLMYWVSQNPPPAHILLISSDRNFAGILHRLRMNNYNILLAGKEGNHFSGALCSAASIMWHWDELTKGENLPGRHFNQPPDGPFNSWYGHYRGPLEDPFDVPEQQNSSNSTNDTNDSSNAEVLSDNIHPVPKSVLKKIREIVYSYPYGLSITELRAQMARNNVTLDKNFYGHKKFSRFLLSMPQIIKVLPGADGQFFVRPVSLKVPDPVENHDTENGNWDVKVIRKAKGENHSITRMVDFEPRLPMFSNEDQLASTKEHHAKETIDSHVFESPRAPLVEQDPNSEMGLFKRLWRKWFSCSIKAEKTTVDIPDEYHTASVSREKSIPEEVPTMTINQHEVCGPLHSSSSASDKNDTNGDSEVSPGFVAKVLNWFKPWKNESLANALTEQSSEGPNLIEDSRKHEDGPHSMNLEDVPRRKHELFSTETFWIAFESFLTTYRGSDIVLNSASREQFAKRLKNDGPLALRTLPEVDLLQLVDLLVSEKKWIKEFPTKSPCFRIDRPPGKSSTAVQELNSNRLSSLFELF